jgi:hypothetical protein
VHGRELSLQECLRDGGGPATSHELRCARATRDR